jgi:hypothetical protein
VIFLEGNHINLSVEEDNKGYYWTYILVYNCKILLENNGFFFEFGLVFIIIKIVIHERGVIPLLKD